MNNRPDHLELPSPKLRKRATSVNEHRRCAFTISNVLFGLVFLLSAAVQFNDPDPWRWMAVYGAGAFVCGLAQRPSFTPWGVPAALGIVAGLWSSRLLPAVVGRVRPFELVESIEMKSAVVEQAREGIGLALVALWMAVLTIVTARRRVVTITRG